MIITEQTTEYVIRLGPKDRYRHVHIRVRGRIVFFRVQLETLLDEEWRPVVRYDTAHGFAHRDLLDRRGNTIKTPLFNQDLNDALTFAENDLKTNWFSYRKRFLEE
ncbi:MAG TPA: hypothetical protein VM163_13660 [bacterium]|nr:hypothetical protein [bacterium]